ncbi:MAG: amidohydrolase family protein [Acidimicrobiales bacterium]
MSVPPGLDLPGAPPPHPRLEAPGAPPYPRLDAHHHLWDLAVRDQPWTAGLPALRRSFSMAELRPRLVANGVEATVVVQTVCGAEETPELLALAAREPEVAGVVGGVDLEAPDVADRLARLRDGLGAERLVAIRHQVQDEPTVPVGPAHRAAGPARPGAALQSDAGARQ